MKKIKENKQWIFTLFLIFVGLFYNIFVIFSDKVNASVTTMIYIIGTVVISTFFWAVAEIVELINHRFNDYLDLKKTELAYERMKLEERNDKA